MATFSNISSIDLSINDLLNETSGFNWFSSNPAIDLNTNHHDYYFSHKNDNLKDISDKLNDENNGIDLTTIASDMENLRSNMDIIQEKKNKYDQKLLKYKDRVDEYNTVVAKLNDAKVNTNYIMMFVWLSLVAIFGYVSVVSIVEDQDNMPFIIQIIVIATVSLVCFYLLKNMYYWYLT